MSTVKISELSLISQLNANTSNTLFVAVDIPTGVTGKFTGHTLAQGLYSNEILNVGLNQSFLPNTIAQFSLAGASYIQTNLVNLDDSGTADIVVTANTNSGGTDYTYFIDMGFANANVTPGLEFNNLGTSLYPLDGYLYVQGNGIGNEHTRGGNLVIGATSTETRVKFIAGGYDSANIVTEITKDGLKMVNGRPLYFTDGTTQNTASNPAVFSQASYTQANTATTISQSAYGQANTATTIGQAAYGQANTSAVFLQSAYNKANTSLQNTNTIVVNSNLIVPGTANIASFSFSNNDIYSSNTSTDINIGQLTATANINFNRVTLFNKSVVVKDVLVAGNTTINNGVSIDDGGVFQYTTANNTTVTQLTSKSTGVISNGRTGQITTNNASLAKGAAVSFIVTNNQIVSAKDVVIVNIASGGTTSSYQIAVDAVSVGSFSICITNNGTGPLAEALVINYAIIRVN